MVASPPSSYRRGAGASVLYADPWWVDNPERQHGAADQSVWHCWVGSADGMFAKQATDKLADIFDNLFRSDRGKARSEPLTQNFVPQMRKLEASNALEGSKSGITSPAPALQAQSPLSAD
jgi:hypothetical protein